MKTRNLTALLLILCLLIPLGVSAAEPADPLQPRIEAVHSLNTLPESWNPLEELTEEAELLLKLTSDRLYVLSPDGQELIPSLAASAPEDVTQQYAGTYGIPADATGNYAFLISLDPAAAWEDGRPLCVDDFLLTINHLIDAGTMDPVLANYSAYIRREEKISSDVLSLYDAGFSSVEEALEAGHTRFYVDTSGFWGLNSGWVAASDRSRLKDSAIPSGLSEMYVSGAYLYDRYLCSDAPQAIFQREFVGICPDPDYTTREEIGLIRKNTYEMVLILQSPMTSEALALKLGQLIPVHRDLYGADYATSPATYSSCGPYRIVSVEGGCIRLEKNPYWIGKTETVEADTIRLQS